MHSELAVSAPTEHSHQGQIIADVNYIIYIMSPRADVRVSLLMSRTSFVWRRCAFALLFLNLAFDLVSPKDERVRCRCHKSVCFSRKIHLI